jgi:HTH-type transcriptional regulator / antitoxin HipB
MNTSNTIIPNGHFLTGSDQVIQSTAELGQLARERRQQIALTQLDVAGLSNTGNRFIVELEQGKPTLQLQKVLDVLNLLGLEVVIRAKSGASQ